MSRLNVRQTDPSDPERTQLYAREHGKEVPDVTLLAEDVWLAHAQVDILCSATLRESLLTYADALNAVARHGERYPDWWAYVIPYKAAFLNAVRSELKWPDPPPGTPRTTTPRG